MANISMRCIFCESRDIEQKFDEENKYSPIMEMHCNECEEDYELIYSSEIDDYEVVGD